MRDFQTIDQVYVQTGGGWRRDRMIRWEIFKQLTKFTHKLVPGEEGIGRSDERFSTNSPCLRTAWRRMKRKGWDNQMRGFVKKMTEITYTLKGSRRRNITIRSKVIILLTKFTYELETDGGEGIGWWDKRFKQLTKFTYILETDEEGIGW